MVFLVSLSLILHLFTFLWIIILMQKINVNKPSSDEYEKVKSEIEDILLSYTEAMKDENKKLLAEIKKMKLENARLNKKIASTEQQLKANEMIVPKEQVKPPVIHQPIKIQQKPLAEDNNYDDYKPPMIEEVQEEDIFEQSDTAKVLSLAKQGFNAEQIARKLDLGKGEVELVLKFYHSSM